MNLKSKFDQAKTNSNTNYRPNSNPPTPRRHGRACGKLLASELKLEKNNGLSTESAANELNEYYARFDKYDFSQEQEKLHSELILKAKDCDHMEITKESVVKFMGMIKPNKACGPDNIGGRVLKECKLELAPVLQGLFQKSLD